MDMFGLTSDRVTARIYTGLLLLWSFSVANNQQHDAHPTG
jgi:hypothetical protein